MRGANGQVPLLPHRRRLLRSLTTRSLSCNRPFTSRARTRAFGPSQMRPSQMRTRTFGPGQIRAFGSRQMRTRTRGAIGVVRLPLLMPTWMSLWPPPPPRPLRQTRQTTTLGEHGKVHVYMHRHHNHRLHQNRCMHACIVTIIIVFIKIL